MFDHRTKNYCYRSLPDSDLPTLYQELFVGRENDVRQVLDRVTRAHIVNINGAPGFGKSALAIHLGHEIVRNGTSVRYINVEDKVSSMRVVAKSKRETMSEPEIRQTQMHKTNSLTQFSDSSLTVPMYRYSRLLSKGGQFIEELKGWSERIHCTTVLNCDDILVSSSREEFFT